MSKISKNIKMLDILSSGRKYTCKQLAEMLEISPRMVRLYKDEIEFASEEYQDFFTQCDCLVFVADPRRVYNSELKIDW